jgi:hypothetical protein
MGREERGARLICVENSELRDFTPPNSGLQPMWPAAFLRSELCHHGVAGHAAQPWSVGRMEQFAMETFLEPVLSRLGPARKRAIDLTGSISAWASANAIEARCELLNDE